MTTTPTTTYRCEHTDEDRSAAPDLWACTATDPEDGLTCREQTVQRCACGAQTHAHHWDPLAARLRARGWDVDDSDPETIWAHPDALDGARVALLIEYEEPESDLLGEIQVEHAGERVRLAYASDGGEVSWPGVVPDALWPSYSERRAGTSGAGSISADEETPNRLAGFVSEADVRDEE